jgi:hypothetical protein
VLLAKAISITVRLCNDTCAHPSIRAEPWSEVDPALQDLREGFADHGLVREVARQLASDVKAIATATVGPIVSLGATSLADLSGWITLAGTAGPIVGTGTQAAVRAVLDKQRNERELRGHDLYYLYEIERRSPRD